MIFLYLYFSVVLTNCVIGQTHRPFSPIQKISCYILIIPYNIKLQMPMLCSYASILLLLMVSNSFQCDNSACLKCNTYFYYGWQENCTCLRVYNYLEINGTCQACPYRCKECTSSSKCTICYVSAVLYGSTCLWNCPDGYQPIDGVCSQMPKLSTGAIVGITIGSIIGGILLIGISFYFVWNRYFRSQQQPMPYLQPTAACVAERPSPYLWQPAMINRREITTEQINVTPSDKDKYKQSSKEVCSVCLEPKLNAIPKCGHALHLKCLSEWMKRSPLCPLCRADIGGKITIICLGCKRSHMECQVARMDGVIGIQAQVACPQCIR